MATKWTSSNDGPELLALVQWQGLLPEDTSWESWTKLKEEYHLEDKVLLDVVGDVMKQQQNKAEVQADQHSPQGQKGIAQTTPLGGICDLLWDQTLSWKLVSGPGRYLSATGIIYESILLF